jgi:hypothetical protein
MAEHKGTSTCRNVYGSDYVVSYVPRQDKVLVTCLRARAGRKDHFSPDELLLTLEYDLGQDSLHFLKNNNVQYSKEGLRGVLILLNTQIGIVVRSMGTFILFQVLLPKKRENEVVLVDLRASNDNYGFYLQQIHGTILGRLSPKCRQRIHPYPYMVGGHIFMDPGGPHFFPPKKLCDIPVEIAEEFRSLKDNLCTMHYDEGTPSRIRHLRNSSHGNVLYVVDDGRRTDMAASSNMFYIPIGDPHSSEKCPWDITPEGECSEYVSTVESSVRVL